MVVIGAIGLDMFSDTNPYRLSDAAIATIEDVIRRFGCKRILELGSGVSTLAIACLKDEGVIESHCALEHDQKYFDQTTVTLRQLNLKADLLLAPLRPCLINQENYEYYTCHEVSGAFDFLLVDGPPGTTCKLARYPAIAALKNHLTDSAIIAVDDSHRSDESTMIQRWIKEYALELLQDYNIGNGLTFLRRTNRETS